MNELNREELKIKKLIIKNIKSHEDSEIVFDDEPKLYNITGVNMINPEISNGTGKTTIFESILLILTIIDRNTKTLIRKGSKSGYIQLDLVKNVYDKDNNIINVIEYNIIRNINKRGTSLKVYKNGEEVKYQRKEYFVKEFIEKELLGVEELNKFTFTRVFSNNVKNIFDLPMNKFLNLIEQFGGLDKIDEIYQNILSKKREIEKNKSSLEIRVKMLYDDIEKYKKEKIKLEDGLKKLSTKHKNKLTEKEKLKKDKLDLINTLEKKLEMYKNKLDKLIKDNNIDNISVVENKLKKLDKEKVKIKKKTIEYKKDIQYCNKTIKEYEKLKNQNKCPTCKRNIDEKDIVIFDDFINKENKKIENINNKIDELEQEIKQIDKEIKESEKLLKSYREITHSIDTLEYQLKENKEFYKKLDKIEETTTNTEEEKYKLKIRMYDDTIEEKSNLLDKSYKELTNILKEYEIIKFWEKVFNPKSVYRKNYLVNNVLNSILLYSETYSDYLLSDINVKFDLKFNEETNSINIGLTDIENGTFIEYSNLSKGERKKVEIIFILSLNDFIDSYNTMNFNLFIFDEFFDGLDLYSSLQIIELLLTLIENKGVNILLTTHITSLQEEVINNKSIVKNLLVIKDRHGVSSVREQTIK